MKLIKKTIFYSFLGFYLGLVGCESPKPKKQVELPAVAEIPAIPQFAETGREWDTSAVCWVGETDYTGWLVDAVTLERLIREELADIGYEVKDYRFDYLTRQKRLLINKLIFLKEFSIKKTMTKEGACFDMKLTLSVANNPNPTESTVCDIWRRVVLSHGEEQALVDLARECVRHIRLSTEFRNALVMDSGM